MFEIQNRTIPTIIRDNGDTANLTFEFGEAIYKQVGQGSQIDQYQGTPITGFRDPITGAVYDLDGNFTLYLGLNELSRLFEDHLYIMIFWTHFIAINLFIGGWIVKDSQKFSINKVLMAVPLIVTYLIGPIGLFLYWIIRIFYAKRISLYE